MKKGIEKTGRMLLICLCMGLSISCTSGQGTEDVGRTVKETSTEQKALPEEDGETQEEEFSPEKQMKENEELFFMGAERQEAGKGQAEELFERLMEGQIFQGGRMALTGLVIDDIDNNGQADMLVMVQDGEVAPSYGSGGLWIYMNEDEPYCFTEEDCSYAGWFDVFWEDIDNDENVEIVFSAQGTGCGAVGDSYKAIFKYKGRNENQSKDLNIERVELPSDLEEDYDCGLRVELTQEPEADSYSAYCPYLDEKISFHGKNVEGWELPDSSQVTGGNARGFFNLCPVEYEGKTVLQASEYLYGEGGIVHCLGIAHFLIAWEKGGTPRIIKWWIEEEKNTWANCHDSRICYEDGYFYYASQLDNYYLYRTAEDGSRTERLAKIRPGSILVQDGEVYFTNQDDEYGKIYRMKTDGSQMEKLCEDWQGSSHRLCEEGRGIQLSGEYVYFCSGYEGEYDKAGFGLEEDSEFDTGFLYRMKKDGSERELIARDVWQYTLGDWGGRRVWYKGFIYWSKWVDGEIAICRMDLDGQNETELCRFDSGGRLMIYGGSIFYPGDFYGERGSLNRYDLGNGEVESLEVPEYTDCCIYKGYLYGLNEEKDGDKKRVTVYRMDINSGEHRVIYENSFVCEYLEEGYVSDIYASEEGVFFRTFVSGQDGCRWFRLTEGDETEAGRAAEWEDEENTPVALPAQNMEYGELNSVMYALESTEGYEEYLSENLEYEEYYREDEEGNKYNLYKVCLPQFNSKIAGYKKINQYFQNVYREAVEKKGGFFDMLIDDGGSKMGWFQRMDYNYVYMGEKYITVAVCKEGYWGGIRSWITPVPVTFDVDSGERVFLEDIMGRQEEGAVAYLTGSVYKYMEGAGRGGFLLKGEDVLTANYDPEQFFLFPEGVGIYYERYAIDCGAAGDYIFVIPYDVGNG